MNRSINVIKNMLWEMGYYIIVIILGFLAPRLIILYYSSEVNGLTSTSQHIINIILLLQAGASTAAIYSLYKPIADNDLDEICKKVYVAEEFFKKIAFIFGGLMLVVAFVTPFILKTTLNRVFVFIAVLIMGIKSFIDLLFTAKFRIVFTAYQQKFYISIATLIEQFVYYVLVFITIFLRLHYIWMYAWFLLGCIIKILCLEIMLKKTHPELHKVKETKRERTVIAGRNYALANELSHSLMGSSVIIMMSIMYGLTEASVYSVYALVSEALNLITTSLYSAFAPSFGNLVASENKERSEKIFSTFQYIFLMFSTFLMMCMLYLIVPFVSIYTHGAKDVNYVNYTLAIILALVGLFSAYRVPYNILVSSFGFFKETWLQPVVSVVICIGIAFFVGRIDYAFVLIGSMLFYVINFIYQHFKLKKYVSYLIHNNVFTLFLISIGGLLISFVINKVFTFPNGILAWLICAFCFALFSIFYISVTSFIFARTYFVDAIKYFRRLIKGKND